MSSTYGVFLFRLWDTCSCIKKTSDKDKFVFRHQWQQLLFVQIYWNAEEIDQTKQRSRCSIHSTTYGGGIRYAPLGCFLLRLLEVEEEKQEVQSTSEMGTWASWKTTDFLGFNLSFSVKIGYFVYLCNQGNFREFKEEMSKKGFQLSSAATSRQWKWNETLLILFKALKDIWETISTAFWENKTTFLLNVFERKIISIYLFCTQGHKTNLGEWI